MARARSLSLAAYMALARRGARQKPKFVDQRPQGDLIWGHATSPERTAALVQIVNRLRMQRDGVHLLLTTPPDVSRPDFLRRGDHWQRVPEETIPAIDAFLDHWAPDVCIWTGGYLRPALIVQTANRNTPMILADVSEDGLNTPRQRWLPDMLRACAEVFDSVLAQSGTAAQIMRRAGIPADRITVTGPLQTGGSALICNDAERDDMARGLAGRPVWLAAMLQPDELDMVLAAHRKASRLAHRLLLVIAPDDETRGPEFLKRIQMAKLSVAVWSEGEMPEETTQVLLADTRGEMGLWYRLATVSLMGSSLVPGYGGQDPYEPAALGSAILYGPNVGRFLSAYSRFAAAGAARIVKDSESLAAALTSLIAPDQAALMAMAGWEVASEGAEVTDRIIDLVQDALDGVGAS